jgi:alkanesulfonate monooxygenase SsuD/methylene tetrahydromethanopterin reductase-like flavin-dependent oxidoreductase (luciferase family)
MEIAVQTMTGYRETLELAKWAESEGVTALAVADHYLTGIRPDDPVVDQLTVLAGIARETSDILLVSLVSPITFRHPAVMLKIAAALDEMSEGRFSLGVGAGWMEEEHRVFGLPFPGTRTRFEMLTEALAYLQAARDPAAPGFSGTHFSLESGTTPRPLPTGVRIVVGGSGSVRTPRLAGRYADEYNLFPTERQDEASRIEVFREETIRAGRDPGRVLLSTAFPGVAGATRHEFEEMLGKMAAARGVEETRMAARLGQLGIPHGTPDDISAGLQRLAGLGIGRVYLQMAFQPLETTRRVVRVFREAA